MSDGKGKLPTDSSPAEIDEGWDALDEAIAAAAPPAKPPAAPDPAAPSPPLPSPLLPSPPLPAPAGADPEPEVLSLRDRHKTDQDHPALSAEDLASEEAGEAEEEWDVAVPTAKHLPRDLPKAPPGERRVARTIMGVGTPEIQAAIKERLARKAPEPPAPAPSTPPAVSTRPLTPPAKAPVTPTGPSREPAAPASAAIAETNKVPAIDSGSDEIPPISALASTAPLASVGPTPPAPAEIPFAHTSPAIEPLTVRMRPGGPSVTPTAGTRRTQPERRTGQGPSNLALILLWSVALISVGLALYLYFARG
jgi:hypothetical protein